MVDFGLGSHNQFAAERKELFETQAENSEGVTHSLIYVALPALW